MGREGGNASIFRVRCLGRRPRRDRHRWIGLTSGGWVNQTTASRMARDGADAAVVQGAPADLRGAIPAGRQPRLKKLAIPS